VVQWLRHHTSTAGGMGSIPGLGTKVLYAMRPTKEKKNRNKDNKIPVGPD